MRISDWSSDVCSSDLEAEVHAADQVGVLLGELVERTVGEGYLAVGLDPRLEALLGQHLEGDLAAGDRLRGRGGLDPLPDAAPKPPSGCCRGLIERIADRHPIEIGRAHV